MAKPTFKQVKTRPLAVRPSSNRPGLFSDPGKLLEGAGGLAVDFGKRGMNYARTRTPSQVGTDISNVAGSAYGAAERGVRSAMADPSAAAGKAVQFAADTALAVPQSLMAMGDIRAQAAALRRRGDEAGARRLEGLAAMTALGAIPAVGKAAKAGKVAKIVEEKIAAPAILRHGIGANRDLSADVLAAAAAKNPKGVPSYSEWRSANENKLGDLFDYSRLGEVPDVPQTQMPRSVPARGASPRIQEALEDPRVIKGLNETVEKGMPLGGLEWYNTDPLLDRMRRVVGHTDAPSQYARLMDVVSATSPRAKVQDNIRMASYYNHLLATGQPIPSKPAPGYGSVAQSSHLKHAGNIQNMGGWDIFENPKPASFSTNLQGNQNNVTIDTHNFRMPGLLSEDPRFLATSFDELVKPELVNKDKIMANLMAAYPNMREDDAAQFVSKLEGPKPKVTFRPQQWQKSGSISMEEALDRPNFWASVPNDNEYGYYEKWQQDQAKKMGISPAQYQASMWVGGGEDTGLGSTAEPFLKTFEARIKYTADRLGVSPETVLEQMLAGKTPLLAKGGSVDVEKLADKYGC